MIWVEHFFAAVGAVWACSLFWSAWRGRQERLAEIRDERW